jgi:hypothetical protein
MMGILLLPDPGLQEDEKTDAIGRVLARASAIPTMTGEKRALLAEAQTLMQAKGYITYKGRFLALDRGTHAYVLRVGDSCCMQVPKTKSGHLEPFRGKFVRIVCIASGKGRSKVYMAGVLTRKRSK